MSTKSRLQERVVRFVWLSMWSTSTRVSVEQKRVVVDCEPAKTTPQRLIDAVNALGYKAKLAPKGS